MSLYHLHNAKNCASIKKGDVDLCYRTSSCPDVTKAASFIGQVVTTLHSALFTVSQLLRWDSCLQVAAKHSFLGIVVVAMPDSLLLLLYCLNSQTTV